MLFSVLIPKGKVVARTMGPLSYRGTRGTSASLSDRIESLRASLLFPLRSGLVVMLAGQNQLFLNPFCQVS